ncbi:NADP-dependent malic enzyme-like [Topomyia yanbarensis]|uniref:NADP-dependent malic enzyme-like n=1 Tax=Topomyia yanbarensis TaxID=2498891 RepID=UPI00273ACEBA|nr:NADP-dependent malic enzyme-like [Topomyia yanbarensis]
MAFRSTIRPKQSLCALLGRYTYIDTPQRSYHEVTGNIIVPGQVRGIDYLRDARLNKGLAFSVEERQTLGIHGLLPARIKTMDEQMALCRISLSRYKEDLNKYLYLGDLQDRHEKLFFRLLTENVETIMPIVYTPTVGLACQKFGLIYRRPRGLFVTINDRGHVYDILQNWPEPDVRAIVVTDGERILGLGDLGACGMGIPVGKLALYTGLAGIKPNQCLPVVIDVGTNNEEFLNDPLYIGLRQKRVQGPEYDELIVEFMEAVVKRYGQNTLIQFEDFANHNAFRFLDKFRNTYCTFNDDIQGTAAVVVAGLYAAEKITNKKISDQTFLFLGAGGAAVGIASLIVKAMEVEGIPVDSARDKIWMFDKHGLLVKSRLEADSDAHRACFAKNHQTVDNFADVAKEIKPSVLIGASAAAGAFTPEILRIMAQNNERPLIMALSNPTSLAECTAQQAYQHTEGRCIFASGSPFPEVEYNGKSYKTGQGNNAYIFPGIALGVIVSGSHHIPNEMFLIAAKAVAGKLSDEDLSRGSLYPPLSSIKDCSLQIALQVVEYAYKNGIASTYPEPADVMAFIKAHQYDFLYGSVLPTTWKWPKIHRIPAETPMRGVIIRYIPENK